MPNVKMPRRDMLRVTAAVAAISAVGPSQVVRGADSPRRRALVLSGGGSHGAYEAGVIAGLVQSDTLDSYDVICGTSIGTLNAVMVATGQGAGVRQLWSTIAQADILRPKREFAAFDNSRSATARAIDALRFLYGSTRGHITGFVDSSALRQLIRNCVMLPGGNVAKSFQRPLLWTATDITAAEGVHFMRDAAVTSSTRAFPTISDLNQNSNAPMARTVGDSDLVAALQASTAIPAAFDPVTLSDSPTTYVDGGVLNNSPLNLAQFAGATEIDTVILVRPVKSRQAFPNALAIVEQSYAIMRQRILDDALTFALLQTDPSVRAAIRAAIGHSPLRDQLPADFTALFQGERPATAVRVLAPSEGLAGSGFDVTDQNLIDQNIELGFKDFMQTGFQPISSMLS